MQERLRMHQGEMRHYRHLRHVTCATEHYQQTTALLTWSIQATGRPKTVGKRTLRDLLKRVFLHQTWVIKKTDRLLSRYAYHTEKTPAPFLQVWEFGGDTRLVSHSCRALDWRIPEAGEANPIAARINISPHPRL